MIPDEGNNFFFEEDELFNEIFHDEEKRCDIDSLSAGITSTKRTVNAGVPLSNILKPEVQFKDQTTNRDIKELDDSNKKSLKCDIKSFNTDRKGRLFSVHDNHSKEEESERHFKDLIDVLKKELKETRAQRDIYKKQYEDSIKLQDSSHSQLIDALKSALESLLFEVSINSKAKECAKIMMRILDFSDEDQKRIFDKKKKTNILGIFSK